MQLFSHYTYSPYPRALVPDFAQYRQSLVHVAGMAAVPPHYAHSSLVRDMVPATREAKLPHGEARRVNMRSDRAGQKAARHDLVSQERETVSPEEAPGGVPSDCSGEPQGAQPVADTCYGCGAAVQAELPEAAGYVPADKANLKRTHRQRGQLLCRCSSSSHP